MRKYLGVLGGVAALCVMSWAQVPAPAPTPDQAPAQAQSPRQLQFPLYSSSNRQPAPKAPPYPRFELFGGGTYAETGFFNAGHWAGLPGWDASLGANATSWLGFVVGRRPILRDLKDPELSAGSVSGQLLRADAVSHVQRGDARVQLSFRRAIFPPQVWTLDAVWRAAVRAPGRTRRGDPSTGSSRHGNRHRPGDSGGWRLRPQSQSAFSGAVQGRLLQTATNFPIPGKQKQDNFRFSMGIVIRNVHKKRRTLEDETQVEP